jgi:hypothetical protein
MALILSNIVSLHGSKAIKRLESEIIKRFYTDGKKSNSNRDTAIKRILFGVDEASEFDWVGLVGALWIYAYPRRDKLEFISRNSSAKKLADHIALYASKVDPNVVVQLDYFDSEGDLIGTKFSTCNSDGQIVAAEAEQVTQSHLSFSRMNQIKQRKKHEAWSELGRLHGDHFKSLKINFDS